MLAKIHFPYLPALFVGFVNKPRTFLFRPLQRLSFFYLFLLLFNPKNIYTYNVQVSSLCISSRTTCLFGKDTRSKAYFLEFNNNCLFILIKKKAARNPLQQQKRFLNIHEYLSVKLLREYGINAPKGEVAKTPQEAFDIAKDLGKQQFSPAFPSFFFKHSPFSRIRRSCYQGSSSCWWTW